MSSILSSLPESSLLGSVKLSYLILSRASEELEINSLRKISLLLLILFLSLLLQRLGADGASRRIFIRQRSISLGRRGSRQFRFDRFNREEDKGRGRSNINLFFRHKFTSSVDQDSVFSRGLSDDMVFQRSTDDGSGERGLRRLGGTRSRGLRPHTIGLVVNRTLRTVIKIVRLQDFIVFLSFTQLLFFLRASDLMVNAASLSLLLFKFLSEMFSQLGDGVDSLTGTKDGVFLDLEGGEGTFLTFLDLVVLLETARFKSLGKVSLNLRDQSLLDVNNELRFTILSLDLLNLALLVEDSEGSFQPGFQRTGDFLNLAMSLLRLPVLSKFHILIIIADKLGVLKLQGTSAVMLGLDTDFSGKSHTRVLVVQLRNSSQNLSRIFVGIFLAGGPAVGLDGTSNYAAYKKESG